MGDILQWKPVITKAVMKYAKGSTREEREDLEQECYLKILENADALGEIQETNREKFVFSVCRNLLIDISRKKRGLEPMESLSDPAVFSKIQSDVPNNYFGVSRHELDQVIDKLPSVEQYIVRQLFFLNKTEKEVAESLSKSRQAISLIKISAIEHLRELLGA